MDISLDGTVGGPAPSILEVQGQDDQCDVGASMKQRRPVTIAVHCHERRQSFRTKQHLLPKTHQQWGPTSVRFQADLQIFAGSDSLGKGFSWSVVQENGPLRDVRSGSEAFSCGASRFILSFRYSADLCSLSDHVSHPQMLEYAAQAYLSFSRPCISTSACRGRPSVAIAGSVF